MSLSGYAPTLCLERRPSLTLACALLVLHGTAVGVVWVLALPTWAQIALTLGLGSSLLYALNEQALLRGRRAVKRLVWEKTGDWILERGGAQLHARLLGSSFVHPRLVILNFNLGGRRTCSVVLPWDGVDTQTFRRLRVRLGLDGVTVEDTSGAA